MNIRFDIGRWSNIAIEDGERIKAIFLTLEARGWLNLGGDFRGTAGLRAAVAIPAFSTRTATEFVWLEAGISGPGPLVLRRPRPDSSGPDEVPVGRRRAGTSTTSSTNLTLRPRSSSAFLVPGRAPIMGDLNRDFRLFSPPVLPDRRRRHPVLGSRPGVAQPSGAPPGPATEVVPCSAPLVPTETISSVSNSLPCTLHFPPEQLRGTRAGRARRCRPPAPLFDLPFLVLTVIRSLFNSTVT